MPEGLYAAALRYRINFTVATRRVDSPFAYPFWRGVVGTVWRAVYLISIAKSDRVRRYSTLIRLEDADQSCVALAAN
jgi:hypothetical protein